MGQHHALSSWRSQLLGSPLAARVGVGNSTITGLDATGLVPVSDSMRVAVRGRRSGIAACVAVICLASACAGGTSHSQLDKIVHAVPTPPGVTVVRVDNFNNEAFGGGTNQANLVYAEPPIGCAAVRESWKAALDKAHRKYSLVGTGGVQFELPNSTADLTITLDWHTLQCDEVAVIAESK